MINFATFMALLNRVDMVKKIFKNKQMSRNKKLYVK